MLVQVVLTTFGTILLALVVLEIISRFLTHKSNTNPQFLTFQRIYFLVYYPIVLGDWLNAPYLYKLYDSYGFIEEQIAIIYVCGFASALAFGAAAGHIVQKCGQRRMYILATFAYSVSCLIKLSSNYSALILGRIASGGATSLLFTAQEMWYIDKHLKEHDFPPEWVQYTLTKTSKVNGILAVTAGIIAYLMSEVYGFGPVAPSVLSVGLILTSCIFATLYWGDSNMGKNAQSKLVMRSNSVINKSPASSERKKVFRDCCKGLRTIAHNSDLLLVGFIQALFESVLCLFVFLWTPVLDHHNPPLGIVFSSFMAATLVGGTVYRVMKSMYVRISPALSLLFVLILAGGAVLSCVMSTEPTREFPIVSFIAFLLFEMVSGVYFPVMSDLKHDIELDKLDLALTTWFRVPLNLLSCAGLLFLHSSSNLTGTRNLFICCFVTIAIAVGLSIKFTKSSKRGKSQINETDLLS